MVKVLGAGHNYNIYSMMGKLNFLKLRALLDEHGDVFKRGVRIRHGKEQPNSAGTRGNQLQRMVKREQQYQQGLANIGLTLSWPRKHAPKPHRRRSEHQYRRAARCER